LAGDPTRNPFQRLGLDPWSSPEDITERLREMAEESEPEDRARLQAAWRELTLHPEDRARAAFFTHPHPSDVAFVLDERGLKRLARALRRAAVPPEELATEPEVSDLVVLPGVPATPVGAAVRWMDVDPADDPLLDL
jgi:hypothetical protein